MLNTACVYFSQFLDNNILIVFADWWHKFKRSFYRKYLKMQTYRECVSTCWEDGALVVTISDQQEQDFINVYVKDKIVSQSASRSVNVGLTYQ